VEVGEPVDWQLWAGPAIGAVGVAFAVYNYIQNRKPKRLQYEIRTDQDIVIEGRYTRWADELGIRFGDRVLKQPRVVAVRITNTGKVEAVGDSFDIPLGVSTSQGDELITAAITRQQRDTQESQEIKPETLSSDQVVAPKVLLNVGEWLEFQLLVGGA
jgi:hypothetical protein